MRTFSFLLLLICSLHSARGQEHTTGNTQDTTEINVLLRLGEQTAQDDIPSALRYFKQALRLSEEIASAEFIAKAALALGDLYHQHGQSDSSIYFNRKALAVSPPGSIYVVDAYQSIALNLLWLSKYDSAKIILESALSIAQELKNYSLQAGIYNDLGNLALERKNNLESLQHYLVASKLYDSLLHDPVGFARTLFNIGNIQYQLKNYDKALQYVNEAEQIASTNKYDKGVAYSFQLKGRIYRAQKKLNEALVEYNKAVNMYRTMGDKRSAAETALSIGNIYYDKGDFSKAQFHYFTALNEAKAISNQVLQVYFYSALGYTFFEQKQYKKAAAYTDSSRVTAQLIHDPYSVLDAYSLLRGIFEKQHQYKEALHYAMLYTELNDSLTNAENRAAVEELDLKYQNEKRLAEIELLKSDKNLQEAIISRHQTIQAASIIVLLLVIIVTWILVNRYRILNQARRQVEIEQVRNGIARDLHDDIGSTLSSINILSQVARVEQNGNVDSYLQRIHDQSAQMMEDIGDIVWSINPHNDSLKQVIIRMREFSAEIFDSKNMSWNFTDKISDEVSLDAEKRKNLFLIFKETVNNAAKYSGASSIDITLYKKDQTLVLQVKDNGQGFDEETVKPGNGLRNLRERAKEIKGELKLKSTPDKGTEMEFRMPLA